MLYNLLAPFAHDFILFNLFRYITFRTGGAMVTSLAHLFYLRAAHYPLAAQRSRARVSRSAATAPKRISRKKARRPWAG